MRVGISCVFLFICCVFAQHKRCKSGYHFWRPYNGTLPRDAFVAGIDEIGTKNLVAKVIFPDHYSWSIPAQLKEGSDHLYMAWHNSRDVQKIDSFIEVLCSENLERLRWVPVKRFAEEIANRCCFVQGGRGIYEGRAYDSFIGKGTSYGNIYLGRIYREKGWDGVHIMDGKNATKILDDFEVLTYDCEDEKKVEVKIAKKV